MDVDKDFLAEDYNKAREEGSREDQDVIVYQRAFDAIRKERYTGAKACPKRNFEPCLEDGCALFVNEYPGRPWWGYCAFRDMGGN